MLSTLPRLLRFGAFELDTRARELRRDGRKLRVQDKPIQLLLLLLAHYPDLVTRDEVRQALWPSDTFVDFDHGLDTAVAKLRSALGESARNPRFVETVGGRGYRFLVPFTPIGAAAATSAASELAAVESTTVPPPAAPSVDSRPAPGPRRWIAAATIGLAIGALLIGIVLRFDIGGATHWLRRASNRPIHAIAVLPFRNVSSDPAHEYFVDGMTEQLITTLAQVRGLQVTSRNSAMQFKDGQTGVTEIGRRLHVDAVVEGSVLRDGGRMRITAQLIDAATDQHLWAQSYDRNIGDTLLVQQEIARSIADEVRLQLPDAALRAPRPVDQLGQELYLRGRYHFNKGGEAELHQAIADFEEAVARDRGDARSYSGIANAEVALSDYYESPGLSMPKARRAAETAIKLEPDLSEAHAALGAVRFLYDWDWKAAEDEFKRATTLNPASSDAHTWYGVFLAQMGRFEEGIAELNRAAEIDPLSIPVRVNFGWVYFIARRSDAAIEQWNKALQIEPHLPVVHTNIWVAEAQAAGGPALLPDVREDPADTSPLNLAALAGVYARQGHRTEAEAVLRRLERLADTRYVCPYEIATAHVALGHPEEAIHWLQRGLDGHSNCMPDLLVDPRFDAIRHDQRFVALLRQLGFGV